MGSVAQKACRVCGETKCLTDFFCDRGRDDGLRRECKECSRAYQRERYRRPGVLDAQRKKHRASALPEARLSRRRERGRARAKEESVRKARAEFDHRRRETKPETVAAHHAVSEALACGVLVKQPCASCGSSQKLQAHHDDYSKPLEVRWMCCACHMLHHQAQKRLNNGQA